MTGVVFDDVTFAYPDARRPALDAVTLGVPEGSFVLVAGATGAGKSTLLRAVNGLVPHFTGGSFSGRVHVMGRDTLAGAPRDLADVVAFVPQDPAASFVLDRVEDELAYAMENLGVPRAHMRRRVEETLDLLDLETVRDRSVRTLSGGERQRVAIASALTPRPRVLVLDEPTSQLDPQGAEDVLAALQRLVHDLGLTVIMAEHRLERVAGFVDLAVVCRAGKAAIGAPSDMLGELDAGPPVARLGRLVGWRPLPLTVRDARRMALPVELPVPGARPAPARGEVLVWARALGAGYRDVRVLSDVNLDVSAGETIALMGRNGAGKTTLLRCMAGLHSPAVGTVLAAGHDPQPGRDVALCPQEPEALLFKDEVRAEVVATVSWSASGADADDVLDALGLRSLGRSHPRDLSAGQRLLVATAAVAATGAPVLLLDEPTRGLDPESKRLLASFLSAHAARGGAVMFATHDVELAAALASRVVVLAGGEVVADGAPGEVLGDSPVFAPQMARVFGPGWLTPEQVARAMAAP